MRRAAVEACLEALELGSPLFDSDFGDPAPCPESDVSGVSDVHAKSEVSWTDGAFGEQLATKD